MLNIILGQKLDQTQKFLSDGTRIPVTMVNVAGNTVVGIKTKDKAGYHAIALGFGSRKNANKALLGQVKGANLKNAPKFVKEAKFTDGDEMPKLGDEIIVSDVLKAGDIIDVIGISKGKGYAGVVKRHGFKGGPRTHGQSDRERAPGSIGQTTTPGRVYKGKRMSGRMGVDNVTIKNLKIVEVQDGLILIKGLIPGAKNSMVLVKKVGEDKKFVDLYQDPKEEKKEEVKVQKEEVQQEVKEEPKQEEVKEAKAEKVEPSSSGSEQLPSSDKDKEEVKE